MQPSVRISVFCLLAALFVVCLHRPAHGAQSPASAAPPEPLAERERTLNRIFSDMWEDRLRHDPEFASTIGDKRYDTELDDYSVQAYNDSLARGEGFLTRLGEVDDAGMTDQEKLSRQLAIRQLIEAQEEARFKPWQMPVNQFFGLHTGLPQLVSDLTFTSQQDYDNYIARLSKVPLAFAQVTDDMTLGMEDRREPPKYLLEKVLAQVNAIAAVQPGDSPFAAPLKSFPASIPALDRARIRTDILDAIRNQVDPAYLRFARFLQSQYILNGRAEPGLWSLPDGDAYYAFRVKQSTTTNLTAAQIHQIGLDEVKKDEAELTGIAHKLGFADIPALNAAAKSNPKLFPASKEQLLDAYRGYIDGMRPRLPQIFGRLPRALLVVKPVPEYMEKEQAAAYYDPGAADGSRPGAVYVNTYEYGTRSLTGVEAVAYHEGLPGHHLQISIEQELTGLPQFRKYTYFTAYTEGWGLYAERLGKDIGFYQDPYSDYGRLQGDLWRAIRLVVDTGVHSQHWTRQQMVDYFHQHSAVADVDVQAEVDRYIAWPAQALGYKIGQLEFLKLRDEARKELGPKFDLRAFHDEVVDSGALPLDILEQRTEAWIAQQKTQK